MNPKKHHRSTWMSSAFLLVILLSLVFGTETTSLKGQKQLNLISLDHQKSAIFTLPPRKSNTLIVSSLDADKAFGEINITFENIQTTEETQEAHPFNSTDVAASLKCAMKSAGQKCLLPHENSAEINAISITCHTGPCSLNLSIYDLPQYEILSDSERQYKFQDDLMLVRYKSDSNPYWRFVVSIQLNDSQPKQATSQTVQFLTTSQFQTQIFGDMIVSYAPSSVVTNEPGYFVVSGLLNTELTIRAKFYSIVAPITLGQTYVDYFMKTSQVKFLTYKMQLANFVDYESLKFTFRWFELKQAETTLIASCVDINDSNLSNYWSSTFKPSIENDNIEQDSLVKKQFSLVLARKTAQAMFSSNKEFSFAILSMNEAGFFQISVEGLKMNLPTIQLNEILAGKSIKEVINIQLELPHSSEEYVSVDLINQVGNSNIFLRNCSERYCTSERFSSSNPGSALNSITSHLEGNYQTKSLSFLPACNLAHTINGQCYYIIGIIPADPTQDAVFQVEIFADSDESIVQLEENKIFENKILSNEYQFYALYLQNSSNIRSITARISSPHVQMYVSVDNTCTKPTPTCKRPERIYKGLNSKPVVLTQTDTQHGAVYIGVFGYTSTVFSISIEVDRVDQTLITELKSGSLYSGQLSRTNRIQYFSFIPSLAFQGQKPEANDGMENVEINLRGHKDKFVLMVNNDNSLPYEKKENGFMWSSTNGILTITSSDAKFVKGASYKIAVMASESAFTYLPTLRQEVQSSTELHFQLLVTTGQIAKILEIGQSISERISPKGEQMYQLHLTPTDENIVITHTSRDSNANTSKIFIYVGTQPFENPDDFQIKYPFNQSAYTLTPQILEEKVCKSEKKSCQIYIGISNPLDTEISYTLTVTSRDFAVELKEGIQHSNGLNSIDEYVNMYFHPSSVQHSLNVYLSSIYGHTGFNVILWKNVNSIPMMQWPFPKSTKPEDLATYHYTSGVQNSHSITLQPSVLQKCWPDCIVLISVSYYKGLPTDGEDHRTSLETNPAIPHETRVNDQFTITASSIFTDIFLNQQLEFSLDYQESKFFFLSLSKILTEKESIIIEMTSLSGTAVIGVVIKDNNNNRYPNTVSGDVADLVSYSNFLKITPKQIANLMKKHSIKEERDPQLIVEITCVSNSAGKFVLTIMQGNSPVLDLMHGLPQETFLKPNQTRFFKYFHFTDTDFSVKLSREIGYADMSLRVCKDQTNASIDSYNACMQSQPETITHHVAGEIFSTIHVTKKNKKEYCTNCLYIISLIGESTEVHAFLSVLLQQDFTWLQEGRMLIDSVDPNEINLYRLSVDTDEETQISLMQYSGEVEMFYSYRYSYVMEEYEGPIPVNQKDKFIHLNLRPRETLIDEDETFHRFNKPKLTKVSAFNKDTESKKNKDSSNNNSTVAVVFEDTGISYIEDLSDYFYETEIYLSVTNKRKDLPANYSIVFNAGDSIRYIYDGQIMGSSIPPQKQITYMYHHFEYDAPARLNVFSHTKNFNINSGLQISGFHDLMKNRLDYKERTRDPITLEQVAAHDYAISYALPKRNGTYELVFLNDHPTKTLNISLSVNARDILLIPLTYRIEHALQKSSINYYEVIVPNKGYITLEITHCTGLIQIGVTQVYEEVLDEKFNKQVSISHPGSTAVQVFKVKKGAVYFQVKSGASDEAFYKIRPNFYTQLKGIPHEKISAGNQGIVYHKREFGGKTQIEFSPVVCDDCSEEVLKKARVQYDVVYSTDIEILNVLGKCKATNYFEHDAKDQLHFNNKIDPRSIFGESYKQKTFTMDISEKAEKIKFEIKLDDEKQIYFVSVVATVTNIPGDRNSELPVFYDNTQIGLVVKYAQGEASVYAFLFACILVMLFFGMTTCMFWRRYKQVKQGLEATTRWRDVEIQREKDQMKREDELNTTEDTFNNFGNQKQEIELISSEDLTNRSTFPQNQSSNPFSDNSFANTSNNNNEDNNPFDRIQIKPPSNPVVAKPIVKNGYDAFEDEV